MYHDRQEDTWKMITPILSRNSITPATCEAQAKTLQLTEEPGSPVTQVLVGSDDK